MKQKQKTTIERILVVLAFAILSISFAFAAITPDGPDSINVGEERTKENISSKEVNTSGGTITPVNVSGVIQNPRWKAFIGNVSGTYVLNDADGSSIYDWDIAEIEGRVYSTKMTSNVAWSNIECADEGRVNTENNRMDHTDPNDNISVTFNDGTHRDFYVGSIYFEEDNCTHSLSSYVNDGSDSSRTFEEVLLYDESHGAGSGVETGMIYTSLINQSSVGYDGATYDFQMMVPEKGTSGFTGSTAYYLYVELGN